MPNPIQAVRVMQFGGPEALRISEVFLPDLKPGQIRVRIHAIGVNRADVLLRNGQYHDRSLPALPGFEASGVVTETTSEFRVGARVAVFGRGTGLYAQEAVVDAKSAVRVPDPVSLEDAAAIPVSGLSAYFSLHELLRLRAGDWLLVNAAGSGVGLTAIQIAKALGLRVVAAAGSESKLQAARDCGADHVISYNRAGWENEVIDLTQGTGAQGAIDAVGGALFRPTLRSVAPFGRLVSMANVTTEDSVMNTRDFYPKNISVLGFQLGAVLASQRWDMGRMLEELLSLAQAGLLRPRIHARFALARAAAAHAELESRGVIGKLILVNEEK